MWITSDVALPNELLDAHRDGTLVIFVGAGASMGVPSGLPNFDQLAERLCGMAHSPYIDGAAADAQLGDLPAGFDVHKHVANVMNDPTSKPNALHSAIVRLANAGGKTRVVTTNFDTHLTSAAIMAGLSFPETWAYPALPLGSEFEGLVHIHGVADRPAGRLVVTDRDFGRAYLTDARATDFLAGMYRKFKVLFIGYSHNDVVMQYLARGLESSPGRFALAADGDGRQWERLGIQRIEFPVADDYAALPEALDRWAALAEMKLDDHRERMRTIVEGEASVLTPVELDYVSSRVSTFDGAKQFASFARGASWLEVVAATEPFRLLFDESAPATPETAVLGRWFCENFVASPQLSSVALDVARQFQQRFGRYLLEQIELSTARLAEQDLLAASRWVAVTVAAENALTARNYNVLRQLAMGNRSVTFLRWMLRSTPGPALTLRPAWRGEERGTPDAPRADVSWPVDEYLFTSVVRVAKEVGCIGDRLIVKTLAQLVHEASWLDEIYHGSPKGGWLRFGRAAIEDHEQNFRHGFSDALVDALRDGAQQLVASYRDLVDEWWDSGEVLLQRLAVHLLTFDAQRDADSRVTWLLDRSCLYVMELKHEVMVVLAQSCDSASSEVRARLLAVVVAGRDLNVEGQEDEPARAESRRYEVFNLLYWLSKHVSDWAELALAFDAARTQDRTFEPREFPDLEVVWRFWSGAEDGSSSDTWLARLRTEDMKSLFAEWSALAAPGTDFGDPIRWEVLRGLTAYVAEKPLGGDEAWRHAQSREEPLRGEVCAAVLAGWAKNPVEHLSLPRLELLGRAADDHRLADDVARLAVAFTKSAESDDPRRPAMTSVMATLTESLVGAREELLGDHAGGLEAGLNRAINTPAGVCFEYWVHETQHTWRVAGEAWDGLPAELSSKMEAMLDPAALIQADAASIAALHLFFLFGADSRWSEQHVLPLFMDPRQRAQSWGAFLHSPRFDNRLLSRGLFESLVAMARNAGEMRDDLERHLGAFVVSVAAFGDIDSKQRVALWDACVVGSGAELDISLPGLVADLLERQEPDARDRIWQERFDSLMEHRLEGLPLEPSEAELSAWADLALVLSPRLGLVQKFRDRGAPPFRGGQPDAADKSTDKLPDEVVDFVTQRVSVTDRADWLVAHHVNAAVRSVALRATGAAKARLITVASEWGIEISRE